VLFVPVLCEAGAPVPVAKVEVNWLTSLPGHHLSALSSGTGEQIFLPPVADPFPDDIWAV